MKDLVSVQRTSSKGLGIFAIRDIKKDEVINHLFNIGVDKYIMARKPAVRTNHSCDPNAGIVKDVFLVAMRNIKAGEEVTFDYSTIIADAWVMECQCGSVLCRKTIGKYVELPAAIKQRYFQYIPEWIKQQSVSR